MVRDDASFGVFLDAIRRFVRDKAIPREAEVEPSDEVPADLVESMRQGGCAGMMRADVGQVDGDA